MVRVCLIEDHTLVREGICRLLAFAKGIDMAGTAADADEGIPMVISHKPDVLLLDLKLPGRSGIEILKELRRARKLPPTLVLTTFDEDSLLVAAMRAGARGYLLKDVSLEQLIAGIKTVAAGGTLLMPALTERLLKNLGAWLPPSQTVPQPNPLTKREVEIVRLLASGCNNREIASAFDVAEGTVKNHVSSILAKLGVRDRTCAVLKALEHGYFN